MYLVFVKGQQIAHSPNWVKVPFVFLPPYLFVTQKTWHTVCFRGKKEMVIHRQIHRMKILRKCYSINKDILPLKQERFVVLLCTRPAPKSTWVFSDTCCRNFIYLIAGINIWCLITLCHTYANLKEKLKSIIAMISATQGGGLEPRILVLAWPLTNAQP